jgi:hypothetical protein
MCRLRVPELRGLGVARRCSMLSSTRCKKAKKLTHQPFEVRIDGSLRGVFEEVRDAITSAQIAQIEHPSAFIAVADRLAGRLVVQLAC